MFFWGGSIYHSHNILNPLLLTKKSMSHNHSILNPHPENVFLGGSIYRSHNILNPGSLYYSHNIMNPDSIFYKGVQNIAAIFWTRVQNIMRYLNPGSIFRGIKILYYTGNDFDSFAKQLKKEVSVKFKYEGNKLQFNFSAEFLSDLSKL
jgi:hypothetical protein